jgi:type I restriction enzyme, S subunit
MTNGRSVEWAKTMLGEIAWNVRTRKKPQQYPDMPFIGMDNVEPHTMRLLGTVPASTMKSNAVHFLPGDVLYGRLRPYLNKVLSVDFEGLASAEFIALSMPEGINAAFVKYRLNTAEFVAFTSKLDTGDRPRVDYAQISEFGLTIPPVPEQKRIVESIESYLSRLDDAVITLERVQRNLKRYRASVLKAAVEGRLVPTEAELAKQENRDYEPASVLLERILKERKRRFVEDAAEKGRARAEAKEKSSGKPWTDADNKKSLVVERAKVAKKYKEPAAPDTAELPKLPEGWCWAVLDQLTWHLTSGSRGWAKYYAEVGPIFIRAQDLKYDRLSLGRSARVQLPGSVEGTRTRVEAGDLLVTITGANVTKTGFVPEGMGEGYVSQHVGLCRPVDTDLIRYIHLWVVGPFSGRAILERAAYGAGKPGLNLDNLKSLPVPLPPTSERQRVVAEVESRLSQATQAETTAERSVVRANRLRQAILKWAFEGKLVDQDPNDEPACVLLERINTERAAENKEKGKTASRGRKRKAS